MKKYLVLAAIMGLSGCSFWNNLSWDVLNPWAENAEPTEHVAPVAESEQLSVNVNKYLWQASLDKLAFMGIAEKNPQSGRIVTAWKILPSAPNERFKLVAEINSGELRADALDVKAYKEVRGQNGWFKATPSATFENEVGQAIITRAKVLYIQDKE